MQIVFNFRWHKEKLPKVWIEKYKTKKWDKRQEKKPPVEPPTAQQEVLAL